MAQARKVLLADPDMNSLRALTKALRTRGYQVQYAPDGARALEVAVLRHPDVVLFDERCTLIEARAFVQILATNPRTDDVPVVITSATRSHDRAQGLREGVLQKPFNLDEVLSRIDHLCRRGEAARALRGGAREIEGGLGQLPLVDLLQILSMNRRTGRLVLTLGAQRGEVQLAAGRPVNARLGDIEAEKALFRLLGWVEGTFAFHPGEAPTRTRIDRSMEDVLLEGMRQVDERARLLANLPPLTQVLALAPESAAPIEPHPVMREVLRVIGQPRRLQEVLDLADAPDLEVLGSLSTLLEKGVVQPIESASASVDSLLGAAEVHALRGRLLRGKPARNALVAKLLVCATGPRGARWFLRSAPGLVQAASDPACLRSSFGTLARLEVSEVLKLDFVMVPTAPAARPLWRPFVTGALGALVLEGGDPVLRLARFCAFDLRLPVVLATGDASGGLLTSGGVPASLRGAPAGVISVESTVGAAVRSLLLMALQTPQGAMPESGPLWPAVSTQS
jgi:DNA-binding response OmpR family regulator